MIKKIKYFFLFILLVLTSCSFDKKSGLWDGYEEEVKRVAELEKESKIISSKLFSSQDTFTEEVILKKKYYYRCS